jgi:hypothetical protein
VICSEPGCDRGAHARGLCRRCYQRWWDQEARLAAKATDVWECVCKVPKLGWWSVR